MENEIKTNYNQRFLLPPCLEDWVPSDHPVRFIRVFVESLDLKSFGFKERQREEGRPNYSSELLLKIWLFGYFEKIYKSRSLEKACKNNIGLVWLTSMNYPDHNTLWRFFRNNRKAIKKVFKQSVNLAIKNDMVGFVLQAVDGTKILADVSTRRFIVKQDLKKLLSKLDESLEEVFLNIENLAEQERDKPGYQLPEKLQNTYNLKELINKGLEELSIEEKQSLRESVKSNLNDLESSDKNYLSLTDKESRMMKTTSGTKFSYNAQGVVDSKNQIIVASSVTQDEADNHQLTGMIDEAVENTGKSSGVTLADAGYFSGVELKNADDKSHSVLVNIPSNIKKPRSDKEPSFTKDKFSYEKKSDSYVCPLGKVLNFEKKIKRKHKKYKVKVYRCKNHRECPSRDKCSKDKKGRTIERTPYEEVIKKHIKKQDNEDQKKLLQSRREIVEPVFGWIKHNNSFNRWLYRGLESVTAQWNLACTVVNLKKLYRKWLMDGLTFG